MGTKASNRAKKRAKIGTFLSPNQWEAHIAATKSGAMQVFSDIERGEIDMADVRKLSNFIHASIALMEVAGQEKWAQAKDLAQFRALTKGEKIYYPAEEPAREESAGA